MFGAPTGEIADELRRVEESAMYSAQSQFSSAKFWRGLNLALGVPATLLAAIAGTTALAESVSLHTAAAVALVAAGLTAVMTTLNAAQRAEQSRVAANAYLALQADARVLRTIDLTRMEPDEQRRELGELITRRTTINEAAPVPAFFSYRLGARNVKRGRQTYEVDK